MVFRAFFFATLAVALPSPYAHYPRQASYANYTEDALEVDLGYSVYKGWHNDSAHLNVFYG